MNKQIKQELFDCFKHFYRNATQKQKDEFLMAYFDENFDSILKGIKIGLGGKLPKTTKILIDFSRNCIVISPDLTPLQGSFYRNSTQKTDIIAAVEGSRKPLIQLKIPLNELLFWFERGLLELYCIYRSDIP